MATNLKQNQVNQGWGGKREGAGRPAGSTNRPQIHDFVSMEEAKRLVTKAKELSQEGDVTLLKFLIEQVFGKAAQSVDITSQGERLSTGFEHLKDEDLDKEIERLQSIKDQARLRSGGKGKAKEARSA